jgi:hypothetical protein
MVALIDILKRVPIISSQIKIAETRVEIVFKDVEEMEAVRKEVEELLPEAKKRVLTISAEQLALMYDKNVTDYEPVGVQATSPYFSDDMELSQNLTLVTLLKQIKEQCIDFVVAANMCTIRHGFGSFLSPTHYQTTIYGTGLKFKKKVISN